ncbi:MAG: hypothetical protein NZ610_03175 [Candidatus Bipolaricaulota bacterium]|nr:hypothetical protein [Candidatus Bipolaricaulota bacterium]
MDKLVWILIGVLALGLLVGLSFSREFTTSISGSLGELDESVSVSVEKLSLAEMAKLTLQDTWVYYRPKDVPKVFAQQVLQALVRSRQVVTEALGIELVPTGAVLLKGREPRNKVFWLDAASTFVVWVPEEEMQASLEQASAQTLEQIYWVVTHEATESTISRMLYRYDPGTRWVGDGLAEYAGYLASKTFAQQAQQLRMGSLIRRIERLLESGMQDYDLVEHFQAIRVESKLGLLEGIGLMLGFNREALVRMAVERVRLQAQDPVIIAGYAVALAFWLWIAQEHGVGIIKTFLRELQKMKEPTNDALFETLSKLTGQDLKQKVVQMDLAQALQILQAHRD